MLAVLRFRPEAGFRFPAGPAARAACFALGAVLLWSSWPMLATIAQPAPPLLVFGLAASVGFLVLLARAAMTGRVAAFISVRPSTMLFVAAGLFANNLLYLLAMPRIGPAEANVIAYLWPVMLAAMGAWLGRSRLTFWQSVGIAAAFAGAVIVIGPRFGGGLDLAGVALAFGSGLVFAIYALVRSYGREDQDVIGPSMGLIALTGLGLHLAFEPVASLGAGQLLAIAGIGIAPLSVSNMLWDQASRTGHLPLISAIAFLTPFGALLMLALSGAAEVSLATLAGAAFIIFGAFAAANFFRKA